LVHGQLGDNVIVGEDPYEGSDNSHILYEGIIRILHAQSIFSMKDAANLGLDVIRGTIWKLAIDLNLEDDIVEKWSDYVTSLKQGFIFLKEDEPDSIVWEKNKKSGIYTVKLGYLAIIEEHVEGALKWWWKSMWK